MLEKRERERERERERRVRGNWREMGAWVRAHWYLRRPPMFNLTQKCHTTIFIILNKKFM